MHNIYLPLKGEKERVLKEKKVKVLRIRKEKGRKKEY